jgi:two-component system OmpR family sensor kinase
VIKRGGMRERIAFSLILITSILLSAHYTIVVPTLEQRLKQARLDELAQRAHSVAPHALGPRKAWKKEVQKLAAITGSEVTVFEVLPGKQASVSVRATSRNLPTGEVSTLVLVFKSLRTKSPASGEISIEGRRYSEIAVPLQGRQDLVIAFRTPLEAIEQTVALVERRILIATAFTLVLAFILGIGAARVLSRRLRRLDRLAQRIAAGDFTTRIVDHGSDEVGQLARTMDEMRLRLATLEQARKEFVANASHELRTPLFGISGVLELLEDEKEFDAKAQRELLDLMRSQVSRLIALSGNLLDLSKVDAGAIEVAAEQVDLREIAEALVAEYSQVAGRTEHRLELAGDSEPVTVLGDPDRILQIGRIFVMNAITHTPEGTIVTVESSTLDGRAALSVADNGPGIPKEEQAAVFERFYRIPGQKTSGSGLGLAIASELARLMAGEVALESEPGRTSFALLLPLADPSG